MIRYLILILLSISKNYCYNLKSFIVQNCILHLFKEKDCTTSHKPIKSSIKKLYFRKPLINADQMIMYEVVQIVTYEDVLQIMNCKSQFPINAIIELNVTWFRSIEEILFL